MTEEQKQKFRELFPEYTVKDSEACLSPYIDIFEAGIEIATKELEAQIEKMVNEIDKTMVLSNMRECEICDIQDIFRKYGFKRNGNDTWEIKEK